MDIENTLNICCSSNGFNQNVCKMLSHNIIYLVKYPFSHSNRVAENILLF